MKNSYSLLLGAPFLVALACGGTASPADDATTGGSGASGGTVTGSGGGVPTGGSGGEVGTGGAVTGGSAGEDPPAGECRSMNDCESYEFCYEPGESPPGGVCFDIEEQCTNQGDCKVCESDDECSTEGSSSLCEPARGACEAGNICQTGCASSNDCEEGETCGSTHRCEPSACEDVTDCPPDFACTEKMCTRISCNSDEDCAGHCVNDRCFSDFGSCRATPA